MHLFLNYLPSRTDSFKTTIRIKSTSFVEILQNLSVIQVIFKVIKFFKLLFRSGKKTILTNKEKNVTRFISISYKR